MDGRIELPPEGEGNCYLILILRDCDCKFGKLKLHIWTIVLTADPFLANFKVPKGIYNLDLGLLFMFS